MKEFELTAKVTISVYTKVIAETEQEAIEIAKNERTPMAIVANGGDNELNNWMSDEIDGEPFDIEIVS